MLPILVKYVQRVESPLEKVRYLNTGNTVKILRGGPTLATRYAVGKMDTPIQMYNSCGIRAMICFLLC